MAFCRKVYENIDKIVDIVTIDSEESDDQMGIEEDGESDWEYEEEPALTFVGDKTPELEAEVENDRHNGDVDEPDDIIIVALNNDKNTDNVFEQPELNFEVDKISEIDLILQMQMVAILQTCPPPVSTNDPQRTQGLCP